MKEFFGFLAVCAAWALLLFMAINHPRVHADEWTGADTAREGVYMVIDLMDWAQTRDIANHDDMAEVNPLLGPHPSAHRINAFFAAGLVGHAALSYALPSEYRSTFQYVTIGWEGAFVVHNLRFGLSFRY